MLLLGAADGAQRARGCEGAQGAELAPSCVIGVVLWAAKLRPQSRGGRSGEQGQWWFFPRVLSFSLCTDLALPCNPDGVRGSGACCIRLLCRAGGAFMEIAFNELCKWSVCNCCCWFLQRGFVLMVRADVRWAGMKPPCLKDTWVTPQFCSRCVAMRSCHPGAGVCWCRESGRYSGQTFRGLGCIHTLSESSLAGTACVSNGAGRSGPKQPRVV